MLAAQPEVRSGATIEELCASYLVWAHGYYRRTDGSLKSEYRDCKLLSGSCSPNDGAVPGLAGPRTRTNAETSPSGVSG